MAWMLREVIMRLCLRQLPKPFNSPEEWISQLISLGYTSSYCPVDEYASDSLIKEYVQAAKENDIVISEFNSWSNPISNDKNTRDEAIAYCIRRLELAEKVGARCCVNIAGSKAEQWDGPHPDNFSQQVFDEIVVSVRKIVSAVDPKKTTYSLETMPFMPPDSAQSYKDIIDAVDMCGFSVHCDVVNLISSPRIYYNNAAMIQHFFDILGDHIVSCHIKGINLGNTLTVHLNEGCPGDGELDIATYLRCLAKLDENTTLVIEHQSTPELYKRGAANIRRIANEIGVILR